MGFLEQQSIRWLALDIDGTLYPPRMLNARMVRSTFPSPRLALAFNWARSEYRRVQESIPTDPPSREGLLERQAAMVAKRLGQSDVSKIRERIDRQFYQSWARSFLSIKAFTDLRSTLEAVKERGVKIALFSDFPIEQKPATLEIADLVEFAITSEESGYLKPSEHAFDLLLQHIEAAPSEVLYVGDSYTKDCQGAKRAGMHAALLGRRSHSQAPDASLVAATWKELAALIL